MFKIAIVDNDTQGRNTMTALVQDYISEFPNKGLELSNYDSKSALFDEINAGTDFSTYILNLESDGIDLAKALRRIGTSVPIIFYSSSGEPEEIKLKTGVILTLPKNYRYKHLKEALGNARSLVEKERRRHIVLRTASGARHIFVRNIMYTVDRGEVIELMLESSEILEVIVPQKELAMELTKVYNFIVVGTNIVNLACVSELTDSRPCGSTTCENRACEVGTGLRFVMLDGYEIGVPEGMDEGVKEAYRFFLRTANK